MTTDGAHNWSGILAQILLIIVLSQFVRVVSHVCKAFVLLHRKVGAPE